MQTNPKIEDNSGIVVGDVVLKINEMTVNLDNQTIVKLLEIIEMLRENQVILLNKIDLIEISIVELGKNNELPKAS